MSQPVVKKKWRNVDGVRLPVYGEFERHGGPGRIRGAIQLRIICDEQPRQRAAGAILQQPLGR